VLGAKLVEQALQQLAETAGTDTAGGPNGADGSIYAFTHGTVPAIPAAHDERVRWQALDIADAEAVMQALTEARPRAVINSAAMTNVDACELHPEQALAANAHGPAHLAEACVRLGAALLHVSTDYVFAGDDEQPGPYLEGATVRPVNHYGATKLAGEQAVERICAGRVPWLVARTALVYGYVPGGRTNFVRWLADELRAGRRVRAARDQVNTPTLADDLAAALLHLLRRQVEGVIHVAGPDLLTRDAWAQTIAAYYELDSGLIDVVSTTELAQRAPRPLRSGLRTSRADELEGVVVRGVQAGLHALEAQRG
jgi:dTDP-4-dehydrorhamnose reductase